MDKNSQNILLGAAGGGYVEPPGQQLFEPSGSITETFTWVCPPGVRSISVVAVGGGGGSVVVSIGDSGGPGGGLGYANNIPVIPDKSYKVQVGAGGRDQNNFGDASGGDSYFAELGDSVNQAYVYGGGANQPNTSSPPYPSLVNPGTYGGTLVSGGGNGGAKGAKSGSYHGGGGGAGGYTGSGGSGGSGVGSNGNAGSGGGGGGGSCADLVRGVDAAGGGGVGLLGQGASGAGGVSGSGTGAIGTTGGRGGSGGDTGQDRLDMVASGVFDPPAEYGGGARSVNGNGGNGAVRIIWPGDTRQFPSTNTGDV